MCSSTIPDESYKKGTPAEIMQRFWGLVAAAGVPTVDDGDLSMDIRTALASSGSSAVVAMRDVFRFLSHSRFDLSVVNAIAVVDRFENGAVDLVLAV